MTEYVALVLGIGIVMVYLVHLAFNLSENYDPLKMFLILVSMVFGILMLHIGKSIATDQGASAAIQNGMDIGYYAWLVVTSLTLVYFVINLILRAWNAISARKQRISLEDDENS